MASLTEYYGRMKGGLASIDPKDATQLFEDWSIVAAAGAGVGLLSGAIGGLDKKIAGFNVPIDGMISIGMGLFGLTVSGDGGKMLKIGSIALGGSAAVRTFERFFKAGFKVKGEFEDLGSGFTEISGHRFHGLPGYQPMAGYGFGFGASAQDRLVEASKYL